MYADSLDPENPTDDAFTLQTKIRQLKGTEKFDRLQELITLKERKGELPRGQYKEFKRLKEEAEE